MTSETNTPFVVTYGGDNYNIRDFLDLHPGGRSILEKYEDRDITRAFDDIGHSKFAKESLKSYVMKKLSNSDTTKKEEKNDKQKAVDLKFVVSKLFTKEDKNFIHKTFGLVSLLSYAYRYFYILPTTGTLGFTGTSFDHWTLLLHLLLSSSSLIFHVVERRIISNPLIIYQEYRLHAILFTLKAVLISLFGIHYRQVLPDENIARVVLGVMIACIHLLVDLITLKFGIPGITTVRNTNDGSIATYKMLFSYYQVLTLTSQLILSDKLCDFGFNGLIAIQSSAFLMTLKRKSIIRARTHMFFYALALFLSMFYIWLVKGFFFFVIIAGCFFFKNKLNVNKYLMWFIFSLVTYTIVEKKL